MVSVYIPPELSFNYNELNRLFKACSHLKNLILTGDFNAHNALWSVKTSDNRGNQVVNLLPFYDLIVLNKLDMQTRTYVDSGEIRHSSPDITFSSSDISLSLSWCTLDDRGSDHLPINIEVIDFNLKFERSYKKIKHNKTDWGKFTSNILNNFDFGNALNEENFLIEYNKFIDTIYTCLESAGAVLPMEGSINKEPQGVIWWNQKCTDLVNSRRAALKTYMNNASIDHFDRYMGKIKEVKEGLRAEKRKGFDNFCESLNPNTTYRRLLSIRRYLGHQSKKELTRSSVQ